MIVISGVLQVSRDWLSNYHDCYQWLSVREWVQWWCYFSHVK